MLGKREIIEVCHEFDIMCNDISNFIDTSRNEEDKKNRDKVR